MSPIGPDTFATLTPRGLPDAMSAVAQQFEPREGVAFASHQPGTDTRIRAKGQERNSATSFGRSVTASPTLQPTTFDGD